MCLCNPLWGGGEKKRIGYLHCHTQSFAYSRTATKATLLLPKETDVSDMVGRGWLSNLIYTPKVTHGIYECNVALTISLAHGTHATSAPPAETRQVGECSEGNDLFIIKIIVITIIIIIVNN